MHIHIFEGKSAMFYFQMKICTVLFPNKNLPCFSFERKSALFSFHFDTFSILPGVIHHGVTRENLICQHFNQTQKTWAHLFLNGHFLLQLLLKAFKPENCIISLPPSSSLI